ncbi:hypothetical protein M8C21_025757 [Ambrosia artemisiifolia]|uniref:Uncharacterized protein n=1 Tax=Ambrosia artemisiifolia TaxID=4212 RepID=A0AAD5GHN6_AMBAR|nr:hypothetical protein M8C21_025757 [Ambrosia artemisiifolia]
MFMTRRLIVCYNLNQVLLHTRSFSASPSSEESESSIAQTLSRHKGPFSSTKSSCFWC